MQPSELHKVELKISRYFLKVMNEYRLARFYGPQCTLALLWLLRHQFQALP